ncbi:hypothetical protein BH09GEM1_BH09GEM1_22260 [soil metagenome]
MDDNNAGNSASAGAPPHAVPTPQPSGKHTARRWFIIGAVIVLIVPAALIAAWTAIALNWSYSEGSRAGYIQKFSSKGWVCKTWEGELQVATIPGSAPQVFNFTVRDDSIANKITQLMGNRVSISYKEHRGIPGSCFGDTNYYVTGATIVK